MKVRVEGIGHQDWDEALNLLGLGYNSIEHKSTGYSPFYMMHGFHPALSFDVIDRIDEEGFVTKAAWVQEQ